MGFFDKARQARADDDANPKVAEAVAMANEKLRGVLGGKPIRALMEATEIGRTLASDERLMTMVMGELDHKRGVAALTDRRIIFAEQSLTRSRVEVFLLDEVDTVSMSGFTNVKLKIGSRRRVAEIGKTMPPGRAQEFLEAHRELQRTRHVAAAAPPHITARRDMAAQLTELAELHRSGALTDSQFEAAKARLLD